MQITRTSIKKQVMESIVSKSVKAAAQNVNSACVWWLNQPKLPKSLKKLRKF